MISYHALEALARERAQAYARDCAMAALAAQLGPGSRRGYREQLAQALRAFARRIDPAVEPPVVPSAPMALPGSSH